MKLAILGFGMWVIKIYRIFIIGIILLVFTSIICLAETDIKKPSLKKKELEIERKEKELLLLQKRISEELKKISEIKSYIEAKLNEIKKMETERYMQLANLYASIPPKNAGKIMEQLDPKIAARIILYMDKKKAGIIWGFIDPKKACKITKEMVRLR